MLAQKNVEERKKVIEKHEAHNWCQKAQHRWGQKETTLKSNVMVHSKDEKQQKLQNINKK